ncbi:ABC transporter ATP-binding protein [Buttiauxella sp. WJP83]|uniref:ABC transporter ATP-binding protein n=1 Tax=Buttiauxella sp. WJP83 TaxID=2986951 RepID=UPI0022DE6710|nr:ABC transporter ATP-binding protein [Buttiauxella sp. WJP83]WBM72081.1 ABC transporter ATP-binding protein [Buttiauxella sp. WJP83]
MLGSKKQERDLQMFCDDLAIEVEQLSKCFHIYENPRARLKQFILPTLKKVLHVGTAGSYYREFWPVRDLSFQIRKGETVGIIGNNGAGKSTLLQMICGTLNPTEGRVVVNGRIAALLELGSGFNPEFTGRENVYLNAAVLGLSKKEINEKYDEIVAFSEIEEFLDQPVKTYSSGMIARLAFSVAVQVNPDILIVDEALSVGDMAFQQKSFTKMKEIRDAGTSILFVSHSLSAVRNFCDTAIWMEKGKMRMIGERLEVCEAYQQETEAKNKLISVQKAKTDQLEDPDKQIAILSIECDQHIYEMGDDIIISMGLGFKGENIQYGIGIVIYDNKGHIVSILNTLRDDITFSSVKNNITLTILNNYFAPGEYYLTVVVSDELGMFPYDRLEYAASFNIKMERNAAGLARVEGVVRCDHLWGGK